MYANNSWKLWDADIQLELTCRLLYMSKQSLYYILFYLHVVYFDVYNKSIHLTYDNISNAFSFNNIW